jgi:tRNA-splicing ligase RtcB
MEHTHFGMAKKRDSYATHQILEHPDFEATAVLKQLRGKAILQLGTSGAGNHFVEFGQVSLTDSNALGLPAGDYFGLLSHSGSRGLGATIAQYYSRLASDICHLPKGTQHLAWLDMDSAEGQEYWLSMNLAGEYAKACHDVIHQTLAKAIGGRILKTVENHHNFAWKETQADGTELIVHRKGATPAGKGVLGIIPGTMTSPAYIVSGKGNEASLNSASHGAGRKFSRSKAREKFTRSEMRQILKNAGVTTIGSGVDESPMAYKDIEKVMQSQLDLVEVEGMFTPKIVRMCK